jgi:hypothetical protein
MEPCGDAPARLMTACLLITCSRQFVAGPGPSWLCYQLKTLCASRLHRFSRCCWRCWAASCIFVASCLFVLATFMAGTLWCTPIVHQRRPPCAHVVEAAQVKLKVLSFGLHGERCWYGAPQACTASFAGALPMQTYVRFAKPCRQHGQHASMLQRRAAPR